MIVLGLTGAERFPGGGRQKNAFYAGYQAWKKEMEEINNVDRK